MLWWQSCDQECFRGSQVGALVKLNTMLGLANDKSLIARYPFMEKCILIKNNKTKNNILSSQTEQDLYWEMHNKTNQYSHGILSVNKSYQNNNH